ncbi:RNA polymerase sigma factor [Beggiatoa alba]|nr:RNA polymerase sigma factor [Beggiatoa alba]
MFSKIKLSKFCTEHRGLLLQLAYSWCHDKSLAEDLVQDATEKALKNSNLKNIKAIKAWFIQILLNCWRDTLRKKQEQQNIDDLICAERSDLIDEPNLFESLTPESVLSRDQTRKKVMCALSYLPIKHRTIITLIDIYGCSYREVAQIIDSPVGTVMSGISRARQEFIKYLSADTSDNTVVPIHHKQSTRGDE